MSDSHGNAVNVERVLKSCYDADLVIHLGDGRSEYERFIEPLETESIFVPGNCDARMACPGTVVTQAGGRRIMCTHGHNYGVKYDMSKLYFAALEQHAELVLFGHTHMPQTIYENGIYFMNPGSVGGIGISPTYGVADISDAGIVTNIVNVR